MRKVQKSNVIPLRGAADADSPPGVAAQPQQVSAATTIEATLAQLDKSISYSQTAAARIVQLVPPGSDQQGQVQTLLSLYPKLQARLVAARDRLKAASSGSEEQTSAL